MQAKSYSCPVCGYGHLTEPPRGKETGGSYEICPSCGFQFGVSDEDRGFTYSWWRENWIAEGKPWRGSSKPPESWNPTKQLERIALRISENDQRLWIRLISVLENLLQERIEIAVGLRETVKIWNSMDDGGHDSKLFPLFAPFIGYADDFDAFPLGEVRKLWQPEGLAKSDAEKKIVEERIREFVYEAARKLLEHARTCISQILDDGHLAYVQPRKNVEKMK